MPSTDEFDAKLNGDLEEDEYIAKDESYNMVVQSKELEESPLEEDREVPSNDHPVQ